MVKKLETKTDLVVLDETPTPEVSSEVKLNAVLSEIAVLQERAGELNREIHAKTQEADNLILDIEKSAPVSDAGAEYRAAQFRQRAVKAERIRIIREKLGSTGLSEIASILGTR